MSNYFETYDKKDCNGCGVCALRCPKKAITMQEDKEGFLYPVIDESKCIHCGLCKKICSNNPIENTYNIKVYAAKSKDENKRNNSTSGGMFKLLAENIFSKDGIVFGVKYDSNLKVKHDYAKTIEEAKQFSISKYVRSDLNNSFENVEKFLKEDKWVLFSGTPCQCQGLRQYLKKDYPKLIICEIICHSNPSPKVFEKFIKNLELKSNEKISNFYFRSKNLKSKYKPYALYNSNKIEICDTYNNAFNSMLISRPSCSKCNFCTPNRKADITIGDFWGCKEFFPQFDDGKGVSLLCINSEKGEMIFSEIKDKIEYIESSLEDAFKYNHHENVPVHKNRDKFFNGISDGTINETNIIKYMNQYTKRPLHKRILGKCKSILKKILKH